MAQAQPHPVPVSHLTAVLLIASTAVVWGFGFPMTRFALNGGISVGALMSLRFLLAGIVFFIILRVKRTPILRRGVLDGVWLGVILAVIFWSQTDGMRFTTTAKSGFITGLYVLFTPLIAVAVGQRIKLTTAIGTVIATFGLYLLVHLPGGWWAGWNRGDLETLLCAFLCAIHLLLMGKFARRTDAWLLASSQVIVAGIISVVVTAFLPAPFGDQNVPQMLTKATVVGPHHLSRRRVDGLRLLGTVARADAARSRRSRRTVLHRAGHSRAPERLLAEGTYVDAAGLRRHADRGSDDRLRSAAIHVPRDYGSGHPAVGMPLYCCVGRANHLLCA